MVILDTSIWIEFFKVNEGYFPTAKKLLEARMVLGLEWIFAELLQGAKNKRENDIIMSYWNTLSKPDTQGIWLAAGTYSSSYKLLSKGVGLIDAAIISAGLKYNAKVWTIDRKLAAVLPENLRFQSEDPVA